MEIETARKSKNAKFLSKAWGVDAKHSLYRASGDWYHEPKAFPFALLDQHGYIKFDSESELRIDAIRVSKKNGKDWLSVRKPGISGLPGYVLKEGTGTDPAAERGGEGPDAVDLREYDPAERRAILKSGEVVYRHLHNKMTNQLRKLFAPLRPMQGLKGHIEFDVLLPDYDGAGRDLLIEAKPDSAAGSIRIAIGQLFDYRRFLPRAELTDLAVLTIGAPERSYLDLLLSLEITAMWFEEEDCTAMQGNGKAWSNLTAHLTSAQSEPLQSSAVATPTAGLV